MNLISKAIILYYLKCSVFQQEVLRQKETGKHFPHLGNKAFDRYNSWGNPDLGFLYKEFKWAIINLFKGQKQCMLKKLKERMKMMSCIKENISKNRKYFKEPNRNSKAEK